MLRRVGVVFAFVLTLSAVVWAAPPPSCTCEFCVPDPEAKCKLPQGGVTTCGIFMRSGICLDQAAGLAALELAPAEEPVPAELAPADLRPEECARPAPPSRSFASRRSSPILPSVLDQLQLSSCGCVDLCRFDYQCVLLYGPGSECVPVGPCQCKECTATS